GGRRDLALRSDHQGGGARAAFGCGGRRARGRAVAVSLWLLGGHDPTRGAGLHRDLVTARVRAPGLPRCFAVTALTEQGRGRPARAWAVPASRLRARVSGWPRPRAIKVGLVPDELASVVAELVGAVGARGCARAMAGGWARARAGWRRCWPWPRWSRPTARRVGRWRRR